MDSNLKLVIISTGIAAALFAGISFAITKSEPISSGFYLGITIMAILYTMLAIFVE